MIYYPVPAHRQKMFEPFGGGSYDLKTTDWLTERVISLPMHTEMEEEQLRFITEKLSTIDGVRDSESFLHLKIVKEVYF